VEFIMIDYKIYCVCEIIVIDDKRIMIDD
jgi:hypothetical protein